MGSRLAQFGLSGALASALFATTAVAQGTARSLEKPRLGDTVVVTAAEALAVSLEKVKGASE